MESNITRDTTLIVEDPNTFEIKKITVGDLIDFIFEKKGCTQPAAACGSYGGGYGYGSYGPSYYGDGYGGIGNQHLAVPEVGTGLTFSYVPGTYAGISPHIKVYDLSANLLEAIVFDMNGEPETTEQFPASTDGGYLVEFDISPFKLGQQFQIEEDGVDETLTWSMIEEDGTLYYSKQFEALPTFTFKVS